MSQAKPGRGQEYGVRHLLCQRAQTLAEFLSAQAPSARAIELIELGSIYVNDARVQSGQHVLAEGDRVRAHLEPRRYPEPVSITVAEKTPDYWIIDKPAGLPVHALVDNANENLISFLEKQTGERLLITHRLDTDTSGLILLARNPKAQAWLNGLFREKRIKRTYIALTEIEIHERGYVHFMAPTPQAPKTVQVNPCEGWARCELRVVECRPNTETQVWHGGDLGTAYRLKVELQTGRTHQIRAQLAALGAPIIGDRLYGSRIQLQDHTGARAIALRASDIRFL
jgi:RluA family pseudouridine synthase